MSDATQGGMEPLSEAAAAGIAGGYLALPPVIFDPMYPIFSVPLDLQPRF